MDNRQIIKLLRLEEEPYRYIGENDVHDVVIRYCSEIMDKFTDFYFNWHWNEDEIILPTKQVFTSKDAAGDYRVMPCSIETDRIKFVKIIGTNEEERKIKDKISVGKALLIDHFDNYVVAILDVGALSSFRTAAISVIALHASNIFPRHIGLIATGRIGFYTAYILYRWKNIRSFRVYDTNISNFENFRELCTHYMPDVQIDFAPFDTVVGECDALFLATDSGLPLLDARNAENVQFISSVGADADNLSEIGPSLLQTHELVTDSAQSMCLGDMKKWIDEGAMIQSPVELKHFIHQSRSKKPVLFISTGIAIQDAIVSKFVYDTIGDALPSCARFSR